MENIDFSQWEELDLRIGKIIDVEEIDGADKLYKLSVDLGELGNRTIVAGLKQHYKPEELKGKQCTIFTNLKPRKLKGIESQGMLLAASNKDETKVSLIVPESEIEQGSKIR